MKFYMRSKIVLQTTSYEPEGEMKPSTVKGEE